jgi:hypothetical protein
MFIELAISVGIFIAGIAVSSLLYWFLARWSHSIELDLVKLGLSLSVVSIFLVAAALYIFNVTGNWVGYYACLFVAGLAFYLPSLFLFSMLLLWWNPHKYKEYGAKKLRKERLDKERAQVD